MLVQRAHNLNCDCEFSAGCAGHEYSMKAPCWQIADLIDFEYFVRQDSPSSSDEPHRRDRRIYRQLDVGGRAPRDRDLLRLWVEERRQQLRNPGDDPSAHERDVRTPGEWFESCYHLASLLTIVLGAVVTCPHFMYQLL